MAIRSAVIGTGFVGAQHVEALRRIGDVEVVAVAASSEASATAAAAQMHVRRATADYRELLADESVEVVHVCTPNASHATIATEALQAGKHVICEKPLAMDSAEAQPLVRLAESTDRVAVLCHNYRFYPMAAELRSLAASGALGEPHLVRGTYLQDWLLYPTDYNWRIDPAIGGTARAIADIGTHWVDLAETVTGRRLESVLADLVTVHPRRQAAARRTFESADRSDGAWVDIATEDQAQMLLRFEGGLRGVLVVSQVAAGHKNDLAISVDGSTGSATWRQEQPDLLVIGRRDQPNEIVPRSPTSGSDAERALARLPAGHNEGWADGLRNLLAAAYSVVRGERRFDETPVPLPTFADGWRHHRFIEAAIESSRRGTWVETKTAAEATR